MKTVFRIIFLLLLLSQSNVFAGSKAEAGKLKHFYGILGTYGNPPRLENGHVDLDKLISGLKDINADVYHWLIHESVYDWDDLKEFLPKARKAKIKVWVCLVPPSESKPIYKYSSEPFAMDYERWATEIATLSTKEPNLVAWSIDDFVHNLKFYTPDYMKKMLGAAHTINPKLGFLPCCYYKQTTPDFVKEYIQFFDGILFPYRAESVGANLQDATQVEKEIAKLREIINKPGFPIYLDIYATAHSRLGASTPEYVKDVLTAGRKSADGIFIYRHQDPVKNAEKYKIIKEGFKRKHKEKI
jgi:hypothetical protein